MHQLYELVPKDAELWCRPEALVKYGEPSGMILQAAEERGVDLIVMGVRDAAAHPTAAANLARATAYKVVASARCPVLTVRG